MWLKNKTCNVFKLYKRKIHLNTANKKHKKKQKQHIPQKKKPKKNQKKPLKTKRKEKKTKRIT